MEKSKKIIIALLVVLLLALITIAGFIISYMKIEDVVVNEKDLICTKENGVTICKDKNLKLFTGYGIHKYYNGAIEFQTYYKNGKLDGEIKEYYISGELKTKLLYDNGKSVELREYYKDGKLKQDKFYHNDKLNGKLKQYYDNGQLQSEVTYIDGKPEPDIKWYSRDGHLQFEMVKTGKDFFVPTCYNIQGDISDCEDVLKDEK